eukprot:660883-Hanusia_phi.AAC.1
MINDQSPGVTVQCPSLRLSVRTRLVYPRPGPAATRRPDPGRAPRGSTVVSLGPGGTVGVPPGTP